MLRTIVVASVTYMIFSASVAQHSDTVRASRKWEVHGYLKDLQTLTFNRDFSQLLTGNFIHNRLNVKWQPRPNWSAGAEVRTRLFWGEEVKANPDFEKQIRNPDEALHMTLVWQPNASMLLQSYLDRAWVEYQKNAWSVRGGRQRINWGLTTLWNANDIFNTYNFLDFDYEERPGRDGLKIGYALHGMSNIQVAAVAGDRPERWVGAIRYFTNYRQYDWQFLAGVFEQRGTIGMGWSGSVGKTGLKGEMQYFFARQMNLSIEADYVFQNGWYLNGAFLYNSTGISKALSNWSISSFQLSPRNLMPTQWNVAATVSKEFSPIFSATFSCLYAPGTNLLIVLPGLRYNMATNIDVDLVWQSFLAEESGTFQSVIHRAFIRAKWSF